MAVALSHYEERDEEIPSQDSNCPAICRTASADLIAGIKKLPPRTKRVIQEAITVV